MPIPKKVSPKKTIVKLTRSHHTGLLDPRLVRGRSSRLLKIGLAVAIITFVAVAGFTYYVLFYKNPLGNDFTPEIIVPSTATPTTTPTTTAETLPAPVVQQVLILDTPTGYLNVRQGPGTNTAKVAQVAPGESYELVSEDAAQGWYQIKVSEILSGWVTKQYAEIR
ncbi:MAG: SH3 domain-containing protein [Candidatus Doudnabacteria bacterium]|nr:SH3 domain-containing protein [Candidatus Doudnabacteria bacterium]